MTHASHFPPMYYTLTHKYTNSYDFKIWDGDGQWMEKGLKGKLFQNSPASARLRPTKNDGKSFFPTKTTDCPIYFNTHDFLNLQLLYHKRMCRYCVLVLSKTVGFVAMGTGEDKLMGCYF